MSMSDPIADFLTRIRNGIQAKKRWIDVPSSSMKKRIAYVLKEEKYIEDFFFISETFPDLRYTKWRFFSCSFLNKFEVGEHALSCFWSKVDVMAFTFNRSRMRFEH